YGPMLVSPELLRMSMAHSANEKARLPWAAPWATVRAWRPHGSLYRMRCCCTAEELRYQPTIRKAA
ncbi:MAG: hypothetical protein QF412_14895, partial [Planctomycetota bacterium]|nr:hypothetical protein [Planctomycetota bacterium]